MRLEIYIRLDFLTSNFRLLSTDTVYWSGVRIFASRLLLLLLLLFFVSGKDRTNDLWKHLFANIIWKSSSLVWLGHGMLLILLFLICWPSRLISPEPRLPQIFENQKWSSARNSYALGSSLKIFFFRCCLLKCLTAFNLDSRARELGRGGVVKVRKWGVVSERGSFSDTRNPQITPTVRSYDCFPWKIFFGGRAATLPDKIYWILQLNFWQAQSHIVS